MKLKAFISLLFCLVVCGHSFGQDIDAELTKLSDTLAAKISDVGKKKVAVIDFTDLQGGTSELGKYIAEQLSVDFVMQKQTFTVLDRANLKSILAEHKLTASGLVNPDNAKKLGLFAGVDALVLGTITPKGQNISVTAKVITTDTAEIVAAGRAQFAADANAHQLMAQPAASTAASSDNDTAKVTKKLGNLSVGLQSLELISGGNRYQLTMTLSNTSPKRSIWVAMSGGMVGDNHQTVTDPNGFEFVNADRDVTGVASTLFQTPANAFTQATEIKAGDSIQVTIQFFSMQGRKAITGQCNVHLGFLTGNDFNNNYGECSQQSMFAKMDAE